MDSSKNLVPIVLVADTDPVFVETLQKEHHSDRFVLKFAATGKEAQGLISGSPEPFYAIFINPEISEPSGLSVVRCAFMNRPSTPVYMITNNESPMGLTPKDLKKIGVREVLHKPLSLKAMIDLVSPLLIHFDTSAINNPLIKNKEEINTEIKGDDREFVPIRAIDFISGTKSFFDVFVKLSSGRYLKLLQAGDGFTAERIEAYLKKGIIYFYIRNEVQESYLKYCDYLTSALLKHESAHIETKTKQTLNQGEETLKFLRSRGLSDKHLGYASKYIQNVQDLVTQIKPEGENEIDRFLANAAAYEHGAGTSMLASLLALHLEIQMDKPLQIIGIASFLHDVGLYQFPEELWDEDETKMNQDQIKLYHTHPEQSVRILKGLRGIHPTVLQAVEQHHLRMGGKGFPEQVHSIKLHKVSEIVGICATFQHYLQKAAIIENYSGLLTELERKVFPGFSRQIVYAFRTTFFPTKREN